MTSTTITPQLSEVETVVSAWCRDLDVEVVAGSQAASGAERVAVMIRQLQAAQLRLARRAEAGNGYAARATTAAAWLAQQNGTSRSEAKRALDTAKRLESCPAAAEALAAGDLSVREAELVTEAAVVDPSSEARLVAQASSSHDLTEIRRATDKVRQGARSGEDAAARYRRLRAGRRWRTWTTADGHVAVEGRFVPTDYAAVKPILDRCFRRRLDAARKAGERDSYDAYAADALIDALTETAGSVARVPVAPPSPTTNRDEDRDRRLPLVLPPPARASTDPTGAEPTDLAELMKLLKARPNLVFLVDGIALKRGYPAPGETCEIPGVGPVPISWIEQLLPHTLVELLVHDSVDIRAYATSTRHRTRPVDLAIAVRDRDCVAGDCHRPPTQFDHTVDFAQSHHTCSCNGGGMCDASHRAKTSKGGTLARSSSHWFWWPSGIDPATTPPQVKAIGRHLTAWNLDHLPDETAPPDG